LFTSSTVEVNDCCACKPAMVPRMSDIPQIRLSQVRNFGNLKIIGNP
jgi:hypothetical protein